MTTVPNALYRPTQTPSAQRDNVASGPVADERVRVLLVPGFVVDTYSEIERSYVELSAQKSPKVEYVWLVPKISIKTNSFANPANRGTMVEPVYVPHLRAAGIRYVVATVSKFNVVANIRLFRRIFSEYQIDAVYTHFGYERFWATFCARVLGVTTIWNEHWHSLGRRYGNLKRWFYRLCVDDFISISHFITSTLPPNIKVHTVRNAISCTPRMPLAVSERRELRARLELSPESKVVLMVAAFRNEKRHFLALDICTRVLQTHKDAVFVFPGGGSLRNEFVNAVNNRGLARHVIAPGHIDNIDDYYAVSDVTMLTSLNEPFGYVVLEAMRHGLPMVAFDNGGPAEIIKHGETGYLIADGAVDQFADTLIALLEDEAVRARLGESALSLVRREYSREAWIEHLDRTLQAIVLHRRAAHNKAT